jgi:hypothetical protein
MDSGPSGIVLVPGLGLLGAPMQPVLIMVLAFWIRRHRPKIARFKTCRPHFSGPVDLQLVLPSQTKEVHCHSHTLSCR